MDNNGEDEAVDYINTIGVAGLPCPNEPMALNEEVNNCVKDLGGGADDGDNHEHVNDN